MIPNVQKDALVIRDYLPQNVYSCQSHTLAGASIKCDVYIVKMVLAPFRSMVGLVSHNVWGRNLMKENAQHLKVYVFDYYLLTCACLAQLDAQHWAYGIK